ncbi:MAG: hypothetical protein IKX71_04265 [Bacteroidales bacterium]|nr:hypothetical protein [Bacteroidales bacterium]
MTWMKAFSKEENFEEFLRLIEDPDYTEVVFDTASGGLGAIHKEHHLDKNKGVLGYRRGEYERNVVRILRESGYRIILLPEYDNTLNVKQCDGILNHSPAEIKTIEGLGLWAIRTKIQYAVKQGAEVLILYFPERSLYSPDRITEGWRLFSTDPSSTLLNNTITSIVVIVEDAIIDTLKPPG